MSREGPRVKCAPIRSTLPRSIPFAVAQVNWRRLYSHRITSLVIPETLMRRSRQYSRNREDEAAVSVTN